MAKSVSITVHPSDLSGEYLTVSDAMRQVLDMIGALEGIEAGDAQERQIVWRLTEAHTNSPPFTVTAEAFSRDPQVSVAFEAERVTHLYAVAVSSVLRGERPDWLESEPGKLLKRALKRNLNGVGHTDLVIGDAPPIVIVPTTARIGLEALADVEPGDEAQRIEYGAIECQVIGLTRYYSSPAIIVLERLSNSKVVCVLTPQLAKQLGPEHQWSEAWEGQNLRIGGKLSYGADGKLRRINATFHEPIEWADVSVADLKKLDITGGLTVQQHLSEFWGEKFG
ncbi:hypothetical protein [Sphingomonas parapaucimobilis]|uniref:Uncharacterized protein n=1 Tax=Sphingomonas parapaucimobilis NBRC 15100 TaxID=1219049 RepID=A0A0A1W932_9SPHN|nr:hypothetical protein [Sphingomonas parapaucimobilis]GAM01955.1 hypothetical protein SP5_070_00380 [Sphingomonas parapaucimobilis NBRC 15100]